MYTSTKIYAIKSTYLLPTCGELYAEVGQTVFGKDPPRFYVGQFCLDQIVTAVVGNRLLNLPDNRLKIIKIYKYLNIRKKKLLYIQFILYKNSMSGICFLCKYGH